MAQNKVGYKIVAIGGSAGSLDVLLKIIPALPAPSGVSFIVIVHRKNDAESILADLLSSRTSMPVKEVEDKDALLPNTVYIAPPDYHLLIEGRESFSLDSSEKIHHSRPSIDVSFESVALAFDKSAIAILLSGANADGADGMEKIKKAGGVTIAQNPESSEVGFMPQQAINKNVVDKILDADEIAGYLKEVLG